MSDIARISCTRVSCSHPGGISPLTEDVEVEFTEIPYGYGFRGGELSTTSSVRGLIPPGCEQETRVQLMRAMSDMWIEVTGCSVDELTVSARDRQ